MFSLKILGHDTESGKSYHHFYLPSDFFRSYNNTILIKKEAILVSFFILILFIFALLYFLYRKDKMNKVKMKHDNPMSSGKPGLNSTASAPNSSNNHQPITSHQQRFEDRRLIERRRIHHKKSELHKLTQVKKYEIKEDNRGGYSYFPKSNNFYLDSRDDDLGDYFDVERNSSSYDCDSYKNDDFDHDTYHAENEWERN